MIGKVIGAFVGDKLAKQTSGLGGASGAAIGVVAASVLRRMSLPAMIALGAGGYVAKKVFEKREASKAEAKPADAAGSAASASKAAA